jgi:hypothetical protein
MPQCLSIKLRTHSTAAVPRLGAVPFLPTVAALTTDSQERLEQRVVRAAEAALADHQFVSAIDVLLGLGWLRQGRVDEWRQGRVPDLEGVVEAGPAKVSTAMRSFGGWARDRGLKPSEVDYVARSRGRQALRFSETGDPEIERAYRTHWVSPALSERKLERIAERASRPPDLVVVAPLKDWSCTICSGTGTLLIMEGDGPLCMSCADMDHLVLLPAGDAALTRRAKRASRLAAVVVRFSRSRGRYERQGILVEEDALERAEAEGLADADVRDRQRLRDAERRADEDLELEKRIAGEIGALFPGCPPARAQAISRRAAARGSGRIGRTAAGRALDEEAITLAVAASVRHEETEYDALLMSGIDRLEARRQISEEVDRVLERWRGG